MISKLEKDAAPILVTGASGFIGRAIVREVLRQGIKVFGVARSNCSPIPNLSSSFEIPQLVSVIQDVRPTTIFHAVGKASVLATEQDESSAYRDTIVPLKNVMEAMSQSGHRCRLIFVSSAAVYGEPRFLPVSETAALDPISAYGRQRVECEDLARDFSKRTGLSVIAARAFSLFGIDQKRLLVWELFSKFMNDREVLIQGTGQEMRDFMDVDGFAQALFMLKDIKSDQALTINVASGTGTTIKQLAEVWRRVLDVEKPLVCLGKRAGHDPSQWCADISLFRKLTGFSIEYDLAPALKKVSEAWR